MDDGSPIKLAIRIDPTTFRAVFDFDGSGMQTLGNCNAPKAVTRSAILYCLRCLIGSDLPLNEGFLRPVTIKYPDYFSIVSPGPEAAVVGGNVLTSQRIVDVILHVFEAAANSYGDMNNLSFGADEWGYYETIGGGSGAGPGFLGCSGVQCHMTNSKITDPEVM